MSMLSKEEQREKIRRRIREAHQREYSLNTMCFPLQRLYCKELGANTSERPLKQYYLDDEAATDDKDTAQPLCNTEEK